MLRAPLRTLGSALLPLVLACCLAERAAAAEVFVTGDIALSTTWTAGNRYNLQGEVRLVAGATLVIEAGTVVASDVGMGGTLVVTRGAQIFVNGADGAPVIMTSKADAATWTGGDPRTGVWREAGGEWGGLVLLGRAFVSEDQRIGNVPTPDANNLAAMEGLVPAFPGDPDVLYGGGDDDDDSGTITCLSLRYGGSGIGFGNEVNGLSLGGVGRATDISYVDVMNSLDDGIEVFGGTVNLKYFNIWNVGDDSFDVDQGWRGKAQFGLIVQGFCQDQPQGSGVGDNCFEVDGAEDSDWQPVTTAAVYNCTVIGQPLGGDHATAWRDNARVQYRNCIFMDVGGSLVALDDVDGDGGSGYGAGGTLSWPATWATPWSVTSAVNATPTSAQLYAAQVSGNLAEIRDSVLFNAGDTTEASARGVFAAANDNVVSGTLPIGSLARSTTMLKGGQPMQLVVALDPRPAGDALASAGMAPLDGFYTLAPYRGGFAPGRNWLLGWTAADAFGFLPQVANQPACFEAADLGALGRFQPPFTPALGAQPATPGGGRGPRTTEGVGPDVVARVLLGLDYAPPEALVNGRRPLPVQRLTVFYPQGAKPMDGWPVLLHSPCGAFREASSSESPQPLPADTKTFTFGESGPLTEICDASTEAVGPEAGFLYRALTRGWAVVTVGTIGIDSRTTPDGRLKPFAYQLPPDRDTNLFYPYADALGMPTAEWLDFELYWGEKDFAWARQFVAEHASELELDDDLVVATGVSCGSIYAASIALGPDRAHPTGSSQAQQSTQCAGFIGFETPAWFPAFNEEVPGPHWEGAIAGKKASTIADADPDELAASSVSRWIREPGSLAAVTPALLVYDEGVAASASGDFDREDSLGSCAGAWPTYTGDPCLTDALLPCVNCADLASVCQLLGLPDECFCNPLVSRFCAGSMTDIVDYTRAHDSWNGVVLLQDLLTVGCPDADLMFESRVLSDYPGLPQQQTSLFTDTSGTVLPSVTEDPLVQDHALNWLCRLRDDVKGTSSDCPAASYRNAGVNLPSLSVTAPVLGESMACVVDLRTTGHPMARVIALDSPATIPLMTYTLLCVDGGSGILFEEDALGPIAIVSVPIASPMFLAGASFCIQAVHFGSGGADALSNAQDVTVGL